MEIIQSLIEKITSAENGDSPMPSSAQVDRVINLLKEIKEPVITSEELAFTANCTALMSRLMLNASISMTQMIPFGEQYLERGGDERTLMSTIAPIQTILED